MATPAASVPRRWLRSRSSVKRPPMTRSSSRRRSLVPRMTSASPHMLLLLLAGGGADRPLRELRGGPPSSLHSAGTGLRNGLPRVAQPPSAVTACATRRAGRPKICRRSHPAHRAGQFTQHAGNSGMSCLAWPVLGRLALNGFGRGPFRTPDDDGLVGAALVAAQVEG